MPADGVRIVSLLGRRFLGFLDRVSGIDSRAVLDAMSLRLLLGALVGWLDRRPQDAVAYLKTASCAGTCAAGFRLTDAERYPWRIPKCLGN